MSVDMENLTDDSLLNLDTDSLILMVKTLHEENMKLKRSVDTKIADEYKSRITNLEREVNKDKQYGRRDCIEISGIDKNIPDEEIEEKCIKILKLAQVKVSNRFPNPLDIHAAHRKNRKGDVIIKFVNRKFAKASMVNRDKLREKDGTENVYINQSLCPEFAFLSFALRQAKRNKKIYGIRYKHGIPMAQLTANGDTIEISHEEDLINHNIDVPSRTQNES